MKEGANADYSELKIGSYKLLTGGERLLALNQNFFRGIAVRTQDVSQDTLMINWV